MKNRKSDITETLIISREFGREIDINVAFERFCNTFGTNLNEND